MDLPTNRLEAEKYLTGEPMTLGYKAQAPLWAFFGGDGQRPDYRQMLLDVETMLLHPRVRMVLEYYKAGIAQAKFKVRASTSEVGEFALRMLRRFWQRSRVQAQRSYDYGRCAYEVCYAVEEDQLVYSHLLPFFPLDATVLTCKNKYAGVRLRNSSQGIAGHPVDLWGPAHWPAKGMWLAHNRRYHPWYGLTQLYGSWRPWRRLAGRDGGEEIIDGGIYRFAYAGPILYYPAEDYKRKDPASGQIDPMGARDVAREFVENAKAGVSVALPSAVDDMGRGVRKWELVWPEHTLNVDGLLNYAQYLERQISLGIGVPPELLEATEVGSGYSGRMIPMEAFLTTQQQNAEELAHEWTWQIGLPLARWNFGPKAWFEIETESLFETRMQAKLSQPPGTQGSVPSDTTPEGGAGSAGPPGAAGAGGGAADPLAALLGGGGGGAAAPSGGSSPTKMGLGAPASSAAAKGGDAPEPDRDQKQVDAPRNWQEYEGKRGRRKGQHGWRNKVTGRVVWDEGGLAAGGDAKPEVMPANVEHIAEEIRLLREGQTEVSAQVLRRLSEKLLSLPGKDLHLLATLASPQMTPDHARDMLTVIDMATD